LKVKYSNILGIKFFNGSLKDSFKLATGSLVVAPSGPNMANDLFENRYYKNSLEKAGLVLPDSGLVCLWQNCLAEEQIKRISGLKFLKFFLDHFNLFDESFWVMPDFKQATSNANWIKSKYNYKIKENQIYIAPIYDRGMPIEDWDLLRKLKELRPSIIFIQLGGGVQEPLGLFLKEKLPNQTTIICTGAALAFLSSEQAPIPDWVDKYYLGWLMRCVFAPKVFVPRYISAIKLILLLFTHRNKSSD